MRLPVEYDEGDEEHELGVKLTGITTDTSTDTLEGLTVLIPSVLSCLKKRSCLSPEATN